MLKALEIMEELKKLDEVVRPGTAYLISYDVEDSTKIYDKLKTTLDALGAESVLYSQWILRSESTALQLRNRLLRPLSVKERSQVTLLITPFTLSLIHI